MNPLVLLRLRLSATEKKELERLQTILSRSFSTEDEAIHAALMAFRAKQAITGITDARLHAIYRQLLPGMNAQEKRLAQKALHALETMAAK